MQRIMWTSRSAMAANQEKLDAISNNLANVNTDGYKRVDVSFQDLMSESLDRKGYPISDNANRKNAPSTGTGVKATQWIREDGQGSLTQTGQLTDVAIDGNGYFQISKSDGSTAYIRSGKFDANLNGKLTDANGNLVNIKFKDGYNEDNVKFTKDNFVIDANGTVSVKGNNGNVPVATLPIYSAYGGDSFQSVGDNLYTLKTGAQLYQVTDADVKQGYTENSNVDIAQEMSDMIITQRAFELSSKGLQTADNMWGIANNLRGR